MIPMLVVMVAMGLIASFVVHGWMHRGGGLDLDVSLIVGLFGSSLGVIAPRIIKNMLDIGIGGGLLGLLIWSTLGAVTLLVIANLIKRAPTRASGVSCVSRMLQSPLRDQQLVIKDSERQAEIDRLP